MRYTRLMILSFGDEATRLLWFRQPSTRLDPRIQRTALRKLAMVNAAVTLQDLRSPPGNRLEALVGDRTGQHPIRINDQWRICFAWTESGPAGVEIVDYH
jgi:proteic killer suppression protein